MLTALYVAALINAAQPGIPDPRRLEIGQAIVLALRDEGPAAPPVADVVALMHTESRFVVRACRDEKNGSSSRGLMQINVGHSRCSRLVHPELYSVRENVKRGVHILADLRRRARGDLDLALRWYSGGSETYARTVRALAERLATR